MIKKHLAIVPFVILLFYYTDIMHFWIVRSQDATQASDPLRQLILGPAYLLASILIFINYERLLKALWANSIYFIVLAFVFASYFWSMYPEKVLINIFHYWGLTAVALCTAWYCAESPTRIIPYLVIFSVVVLAETFLVVQINPATGIHNVLNRWQGTFSHPNTLGTMCLVSVWANMANILTTRKKIIKSLNAVLIILAFVSIYFANSMTSLICSILILFLPVIKKTATAEGIKKMLWGAGLGYAALLILTMAYAIKPDILSKGGFFIMLGREPNLTGRMSLWDAGMQAFHNKALAGWSFDSQASILAQSIIEYGQFHNGYINILVAGGIIGALLCLGLLLSILWKLLNRVREKKDLSVEFLVLFLVLLVNNITEASLLSSSNILWFMLVYTGFFAGIPKDQKPAQADFHF